MPRLCACCRATFIFMIIFAAFYHDAAAAVYAIFAAAVFCRDILRWYHLWPDVILFREPPRCYFLMRRRFRYFRELDMRCGFCLRCAGRLWIICCVAIWCAWLMFLHHDYAAADIYALRCGLQQAFRLCLPPLLLLRCAHALRRHATPCCFRCFALIDAISILFWCFLRLFIFSSFRAFSSRLLLIAFRWYWCCFFLIISMLPPLIFSLDAAMIFRHAFAFFFDAFFLRSYGDGFFCALHILLLMSAMMLCAMRAKERAYLIDIYAAITPCFGDSWCRFLLRLLSLPIFDYAIDAFRLMHWYLLRCCDFHFLRCFIFLRHFISMPLRCHFRQRSLPFLIRQLYWYFAFFDDLMPAAFRAIFYHFIAFAAMINNVFMPFRVCFRCHFALRG